MISKTAGGGWKRDVLSRTHDSLRPCLLSWAAILLSCLFLLKSVACLSRIAITRYEELISLVPFYLFFLWNTLNDKLGSVSGRRINSRVTLLLLTDWLTWLKIVEKHYLSLKKIQWSASKKLKMLDLLAPKAWSHKQPGGSWLSLFAFPYRDTLSVCAQNYFTVIGWPIPLNKCHFCDFFFFWPLRAATWCRAQVDGNVAAEV